ncbi:hypothetical protein FHX77_000941 [Bifidobacterium commune]|uniref:hypothetical protein n=1 Tax=Bifidobacterium commune TaxID=1505727 RepID=UPI00181402B2|nr:hypothetical protein [Bifidobacterium commune]MBB2955520.1 hypothetical protein [Bifidobacterium commune]
MENSEDGLEQNSDIAGKRPVLDVRNVAKLGSFLAHFTATRNLRRASDAELHEQL